MKKSLFLAACLVLPGFAQARASCEARLSDWAEQLAPDRQYDEYSARCKPWPADPSLTLAAIAFPHDVSDSKNAVQDLLVVVANSESGEVKAHVLHESAIRNISVDDRLMEIRPPEFDTAPYQLAPDKRAFGIRSVSDNHSMFPADSIALNLYVIEDQTLRPVLTRMLVSSYHAEWDGQCAGKAHYLDRMISLGAPGKDKHPIIPLRIP